jgi:hypothetical protein
MPDWARQGPSAKTNWSKSMFVDFVVVVVESVVVVLLWLLPASFAPVLNKQTTNFRPRTKQSIFHALAPDAG